MSADAQQNVETDRNALKSIIPVLFDGLQYLPIDYYCVITSYLNYVFHKLQVFGGVELVGDAAEGLVEGYDLAYKKYPVFSANEIHISDSPIASEHVLEAGNSSQQQLVLAETVPREKNCFDDVDDSAGETWCSVAVYYFERGLLDLERVGRTADHDLQPLLQWGLEILNQKLVLLFIVLRSSLQIGVVAETVLRV